MRIGLYISLFLVVSILSAGCSQTNLLSSSKNQLSFSTDTLTFDTVFATIGSTTGNFKVYNRTDNPVLIQNIQLVNGSITGFHINVDGTNPTNNEVQQVEIKAHDSIFVFVSVTVNPLQQNNPVLIEDSVLFVTSTNKYAVKLIAYGQNVTIFRNQTIHHDTTLTAEKPYLVFGYLALDSNKTLTIQPGAKIYFHQNASLLLKGNLIAQGGESADQHIILQGDRLDWLFPDVPYSYLSGQWYGVQCLGSESTYQLNHVIIKNGRVGISVGVGSSSVPQPSITIANSQIQNFDSCGIEATNVNLFMYNTEVSNCKSYCLNFQGGVYQLTHNTIANFYNDIYTGKQRDGNPSVIFSNKIHQQSVPLKVTMNNCVISGSQSKELAVADTIVSNDNQFHFDHCYIMAPPFFTSVMNGTIWGKLSDHLFVSTSISPSYYNFKPDSLSILRGAADPIVSKTPPYQYDMNGIDRFWQNKPDVGAYEWIPKNGIPSS
ncbi:MAG: hypothetical protein ACP5F6_04260 [Microbacter sp.]